MAGDEQQAEQVVIVVGLSFRPDTALGLERRVEGRFEIRSGLLADFQFASDFLVLAIKQGSPPQQSMARCLAVAISQAPGLSGTPDCGHCCRAATSASCARSSAIPTSRTMRVRPAISFADSILQTASMAPWVSVVFTSSITSSFHAPAQAAKEQPTSTSRHLLFKIAAKRGRACKNIPLAT